MKCIRFCGDVCELLLLLPCCFVKVFSEGLGYLSRLEGFDIFVELCNQLLAAQQNYRKKQVKKTSIQRNVIPHDIEKSYFFRSRMAWSNL